VIVDSAVYEEGRRTDGPLEQRRPGSFVWIGL
jgi:hypothetical protein